MVTVFVKELDREVEGHFYIFDSEMDDVVVATFKELN